MARGPTLRDNSATKLVDERIRRKRAVIRGNIQYNRSLGQKIIQRLTDGTGGADFPGADQSGVVDVAIGADRDGAAIGGTADALADQREFPIILNVPVAPGSKSLGKYRFLNQPVRIERSESGRLEVVGLSKRGPGFIHKVRVSVSSGTVIPGSQELLGSFQAPIEYGDIEDVGGYGTVPYGVIGVYDAAGVFIRLV